MKKFTIGIFIAIILNSCNKEANSPQSVVQNFEENIHLGKIELAKKYASEATSKALDSNPSFLTKQLDPDFKFIFVRDSISSNKAWVWYKNQDGEEMREKLIKVDDKWLVADRQKVEIEKVYFDSGYKRKTMKIKTKPN